MGVLEAKLPFESVAADTRFSYMTMIQFVLILCYTNVKTKEIYCSWVLTFSLYFIHTGTVAVITN